VRHNARARRELGEKLVAHARHDRGEQVDGHDRRIGDRGREQVPLLKTHAVRHARVGGLRVGIRDGRLADVDAEAAACTKALDGGDDEPAVTRPEVDDEVAGPDARQLQHLVDDPGGRHGDRRHAQRLKVVGERSVGECTCRRDQGCTRAIRQQPGQMQPAVKAPSERRRHSRGQPLRARGRAFRTPTHRRPP
jgi:hypothetical protein